MGGEVTLATTVVAATFVAFLRKIDILYIVPAGQFSHYSCCGKNTPLINGHPSIIILTCIPIFSTLDYGKLSSFLHDFNLF